MDNDGVKFIVVVGIIFAVMIVGLSFTVPVRGDIIQQTKKYEIYRCTAPFGILWVETDGMGTFLFISGSMTIDSELSESYIVKYMDGDLKTLILKATETPVRIDGKFFLSETWEISKDYNIHGQIIHTYDGRNQHKDYWGNPLKHEWIIHIPELPKVNQTVTYEWTGVEK